MGNTATCDLAFYEEYAGMWMDIKNIVPYYLFYGVFQLTAFLSVFFPNFTYIAEFVRTMWKAHRIAYMAQGGIMYSW